MIRSVAVVMEVNTKEVAKIIILRETIDSRLIMGIKETDLKVMDSTNQRISPETLLKTSMMMCTEVVIAEVEEDSTNLVVETEEAVVEVTIIEVVSVAGVTEVVNIRLVGAVVATAIIIKEREMRIEIIITQVLILLRDMI